MKIIIYSKQKGILYHGEQLLYLIAISITIIIYIQIKFDF